MLTTVFDLPIFIAIARLLIPVEDKASICPLSRSVNLLTLRHLHKDHQYFEETIDSILLLEEGFKVMSVDASDKMLKYALKERWNRRNEPAFNSWGKL
ncbi:Glycine N-methyltransferase like protein [Argiope bruennichi]|uniref:Glycine N-methyltransferase n=1 Tax=Argiope bruennichi TaxID=94029 RepID=A0A8T0F3Y2_ARGBR|nr:Glycine N-methyltransferase like protein [Argiope bruennichi]